MNTMNTSNLRKNLKNSAISLLRRLLGKKEVEQTTVPHFKRCCKNCAWGQDTTFCRCPLGNCVDQDDCDTSAKWKPIGEINKV